MTVVEVVYDSGTALEWDHVHLTEANTNNRLPCSLHYFGRRHPEVMHLHVQEVARVMTPFTIL